MKNQSNNNNKLLASMLFVIAITLSMYYGAQSHAPGQDISDMAADRAVMAMVVPSFNIPSIPLLKDVEKELAFKKFTQSQQLVESDTIDPKELKKRAEAYDKAMEGLKATKEWQEVEKLREKMVEEQMSYMKELTPLMEDALRLAEESMALEQLDLIEIEEHLARVSEVMKDLQIDVEIERMLELNSKVLEETMQHMEIVMEEMNLAEIEDAVQFYKQEAKVIALEAKAMALDAEKIAAEAKKQVEAVEGFFNELKPELIKDGYIKSSEDLDQLKFKDGEVYVNGKKVKAKDAKKYNKIHDKYFDGDDDFIMN
jgi:hypothetical protein